MGVNLCTGKNRPLTWISHKSYKEKLYLTKINIPRQGRGIFIAYSYMYYNKNKELLREKMNTELGISFKEKIQALLLIQKYKKIDMEMLKNHFDSSARAITILSILEIHGFITKLDNSNRWEIRHQNIEEFLNQPQCKQYIENNRITLPERTITISNQKRKLDWTEKLTGIFLLICGGIFIFSIGVFFIMYFRS